MDLVLYDKANKNRQLWGRQLWGVLGMKLKRGSGQQGHYGWGCRTISWHVMARRAIFLPIYVKVPNSSEWPSVR